MLNFYWPLIVCSQRIHRSKKKKKETLSSYDDDDNDGSGVGEDLELLPITKWHR